MKLYHCVGARSMRPVWTAAEMGLDIEVIQMTFPPRFTYPGYKEINPLGTVPTLVDGDLVLTESSAISQYFVDRYGPSDLGVAAEHPEYGAYLNWLHRSDATLTFPQTLVLRYTQLEPEERRIQQVADDYKQWFLARMRCVEEATSEREYLVADRFTIADICVGYAVYLALTLNIDEVLRPNTRRWWEQISARPAYERIKDQ
ncbi:MAG: glutathione S-transferase family protein [Pseudomonadota bacterium]